MDMSAPQFLTSTELADRWRLSGQTLANWRHARQGPPFHRIGGRPLYRLDQIEAYEAANSHCLPPAQAQPTLQPEP